MSQGEDQPVLGRLAYFQSFALFSHYQCDLPLNQEQVSKLKETLLGEEWSGDLVYARILQNPKRP